LEILIVALVFGIGVVDFLTFALGFVGSLTCAVGFLTFVVVDFADSWTFVVDFVDSWTFGVDSLTSAVDYEKHDVPGFSLDFLTCALDLQMVCVLGSLTS
jgi:hypothetical protein